MTTVLQILTIVLLWVAVLVAGGVVLKNVVAFTSYANPWSNQLVFASCKEGGAAKPELCDQLEQLWRLYSRPYGEVTQSARVARQLDFVADVVLRDANETVALPELTVSGVDVVGLVKLGRSLIEPGGHSVELALSRDDHVISVKAVLKHNGTPQDDWTFFEHFAKDTDIPKVKTKLLGRCVFALLQRFSGPEQNLEPFDERSLGLYHRGRTYLSLYIEDREGPLLDQAIEALKELVERVPGHVEAHVLLGIALLERMDEPSAIRALDAAVAQDGAVSEAGLTTEQRLERAENVLLLARALNRTGDGKQILRAEAMLDTTLAALEPADANDERDALELVLVAMLRIERSESSVRLLAQRRLEPKPDAWIDEEGRDVSSLVKASKERVEEARAALDDAGKAEERCPPTRARCARVTRALEAGALRLKTVRALGAFEAAQIAAEPTQARGPLEVEMNTLQEARASEPYDAEALLALGTYHASRRLGPDGSLALARVYLEQLPHIEASRAPRALEQLAIVSIRQALLGHRPGAAEDARPWVKDLADHGPYRVRAGLLACVLDLIGLPTETTKRKTALEGVAERLRELRRRTAPHTRLDARTIYLQFVACAELARTAGAKTDSAIREATSRCRELEGRNPDGSGVADADPFARELHERAHETIKGAFTTVDLEAFFE